MKIQLFFPIEWQILIGLFLFLNSNATAQNCGMNLEETEFCRWGLPYPSCSLEGVDEKCIGLKFHFLNNTTGPIDSPTDNHFGHVVEQLNIVLKVVK